MIISWRFDALNVVLSRKIVIQRIRKKEKKKKQLDNVDRRVGPETLNARLADHRVRLMHTVERISGANRCRLNQ